MTLDELVDLVTRAMSIVEGFEVTAEEAAARHIAFPTLPQRLYNPGDIREWKHNGVAYPEQSGYVDFLAWAKLQPGSVNPQAEALAEGWRVLRVLATQYINGQYTHGVPPNLIQMIAVYAPACDKNNPGSYSSVVAAKVGIPADVVLKSLVTVEA